MPQNPHVESAIAEEDRYSEAGDLSNFEAYRAAGTELSLRLGWLPGTPTSQTFMRRARRLRCMYTLPAPPSLFPSHRRPSELPRTSSLTSSSRLRGLAPNSQDWSDAPEGGSRASDSQTVWGVRNPFHDQALPTCARSNLAAQFGGAGDCPWLFPRRAKSATSCADPRRA